MNYALIKEKRCFNIAVFENEEVANEFRNNFITEGVIDNLIKLDEDSQFGIGDKYEDGIWTKNIPALDLTNLKYDKVLYSKLQFADFLQNNPLEYNNELYSVTQEKQSLLTAAIAAYQLKLQAGLPAELKWNTTGNICRVFTLEEIIGLVAAITDYVQPRIEHQQAMEIQINSCNTIEELESIVIDYETI